MKEVSTELRLENAGKLTAYAHKAASTAGRIAAEDRAKGDAETLVNGKATLDRYKAARTRTATENEHLAFIKAMAVLEKLSGVRLADSLATAPAKAEEKEASNVAAVTASRAKATAKAA